MNQVRDRRRERSVIEAVEDSTVAEHLVPERLGEPRDGLLRPVLPATDEDSFPAALTGQLRSRLGHPVQESMHPVALASLPLFTHGRVELSWWTTPDLPGTFVRRLDELVLHPAHQTQRSESPILLAGVHHPHRNVLCGHSSSTKGLDDVAPAATLDAPAAALVTTGATAASNGAARG
jgi:hypothetical protein